MEIVADQKRDERKELEEFSFDLFLLIPDERTVHLEENGLAKVGIIIKPGMILIGKIGKTRAYDPTNQPNSLEVHGWPFENG